MSKKQATDILNFLKMIADATVSNCLEPAHKSRKSMQTNRIRTVANTLTATNLR